MFPRSSLAVKGLVCELPPIDSGYRGEIHAIVSNVSNIWQTIKKDTRIGQLVITPVIIADFVLDLGTARDTEGLWQYRKINFYNQKRRIYRHLNTNHTQRTERRIIIMITFGEKIKHLRNKNHLTQKQLGLALGFSENSADIRIAQYESGERMPGEDILRKVAKILMFPGNTYRSSII